MILEVDYAVVDTMAAHAEFWDLHWPATRARVQEELAVTNLLDLSTELLIQSFGVPHHLLGGEP